MFGQQFGVDLDQPFSLFVDIEGLQNSLKNFENNTTQLALAFRTSFKQLRDQNDMYHDKNRKKRQLDDEL
eukprot:gene14998-4462_t